KYVDRICGLIVTRLVQVILDRLAGSLYFGLGGNFGNADTPPVLVARGHGLRQNLHVDDSGNGLLLRVFDGSLELVHRLDRVGLAAVSRADGRVVHLDDLALVDAVGHAVLEHVLLGADAGVALADLEVVDAAEGSVIEYHNVDLLADLDRGDQFRVDRKSTRLNSSHVSISYAVFCLKK